MLQALRGACGPLVVIIAALAGLVGVIFHPILGFEFMDYDVSIQVLRNPHIRGLTWANVVHILTSRCVTSYYPVRTLTYLMDYQLWGLSPAGFGLTNILLHLANVLLVFWLILRLRGQPEAAQTRGRDLALAGLAAGLFASHPVVVEPVAWVAGREELLMCLGALGCLHFHITARRLEQRQGSRSLRRACYTAAALCCAGACLSNAAGAVIPLLVAAWDVLLLERPALGKTLRGTAALWMIALAAFVLKKIGDPALPLGESGLFSIQRLMLVLNVYWLNLRTIVWPTELAFLRAPLSPVTFLERGVLLGGAAVVLTGGLAWRLRSHRPLLFGLVWFGLALLPTAQILPHHIHRADRYLYLPLVGLAIAAAMVLLRLSHTHTRGDDRPSNAGSAPQREQPVSTAPGRLALGGRGSMCRARWLSEPSRQRMAMAAAGATAACLVLALSLRSAGQVQTWRSRVTVWENCVRIDPANSLARAALAENLAARGETDLAAQHREAQMRLDFDNPTVMRMAALFQARAAETQSADYSSALSFAKRACELTQWQDAECLHTLAAVYSSWAKALVEQQDLARAVDFYRQALRADPDYQPALFQLATVLATCSDERLRDPAQAVQLAERACQLMEQPDAFALTVLAAAYAEAFQFDSAMKIAEQAIPLAQAADQVELATELQRRLASYRKRIPPEVLRH